MYCPPLTFGPLRFWRVWSRGEVTAWFSSSTPILTNSARTAIHAIREMLGLPEGAEVLAPAYNCGTELDALLKSGLSVRLYRVDAEGLADLDDIERRIGPKTEVVYVIHYFGFAQDIAQISALCRSKGLLLIEDCALSLFSKHQGVPLGTAGDIAVFSLPKTLPVPDGGVLLINNRSIGHSIPRFDKPPPLRRIVQKALSLLKAGALRGIDAAFPGLACGLDNVLRRQSPEAGEESPFPDMPSDYYYSCRFSRRRLSAASRFLIDRMNVANIVQHRRANYSYLAQRLVGIPGVRMMFDCLPDDVCPLLFPVFVDQRNVICRELQARNISAIPWWSGYHRAFDWRDFPDARWLKDNLLALPIHQAIDQAHLGYIADTLNRLLQR